jgi:hypothetical protein
MLIVFLFSTLLRVTGVGDYSANFIYVKKFGFYKGGIVRMAWQWSGEPQRREDYPVDLLVMTGDQLSKWRDSRELDGTWHTCSASTVASANWSTNLGAAEQTHNLTILADGIYQTIIRHCSLASGTYNVDCVFLNPGNQHLDARDVPFLTFLPIAIPGFGALLVLWIALILIRRSGFHRIYVLVGSIILLYIVFLVFSQVALARVRDTGIESVWWELRHALEYVYEVLLFSFLVVASTGWPLLAIRLRPCAVIASVIAVVHFLGSFVLQVSLAIVGWQYVNIVVQMASLIWILRTIARNTKAAGRYVKAHLLVIRNSGIAPSTTPIFQKYVLYRRFLSVIGFTFLAFLALNLTLAALRAANWVVSVVKMVVQCAIMCILMFLYRPRGAEFDRYFGPDVVGEGMERGKVLLEDLDSFAIDGGPEDGMKDWEEGMRLPLQPVVIASRSQRAEGSEGPYSAIAANLPDHVDP